MQFQAQVDRAAALWARDLMYLYEWSNERRITLSAEGAQNVLRRAIPSSVDELKRVLDAEFAWLVVSSAGFLATYDLAHADQSFFGSRSHLVSALLQSTPFWKEVRGHCLRIEPRENLKACGQRLRRDLEISQMVSSNVSVFLTGGLVFKLGKAGFKKYLGGWATARFGGVMAAIKGSRPAMLGLASTAVLLPTGLIIAAVLDERETSGKYLADLEKTIDQDLKKLNEEKASASVMYGRQYELKQLILEFAVWLHKNVPSKTEDPRLVEQFAEKLRTTAPGFSPLCEARSELTVVRERAEQKLSATENIDQRLVEIANKKAHGEKLADGDVGLYEDAQYLASLRLSLKALLACPSAR
ncbi:MAG: hypothetical protein IPJ84_07165 [Bdellovibrionales bacterium]|nr:hypothetical protein [Bdellovibrionales bacterium]